MSVQTRFTNKNDTIASGQTPIGEIGLNAPYSEDQPAMGDLGDCGYYGYERIVGGYSDQTQVIGVTDFTSHYGTTRDACNLEDAVSLPGSSIFTPQTQDSIPFLSRADKAQVRS